MPDKPISKLQAWALTLFIGTCLIPPVYVYSKFRGWQEKSKTIPTLRIEKILNNLKLFDKKFGRLPDNFIELKNQQLLDKSIEVFANGAAIDYKNYLYIYRPRAKNEGADLWAIPNQSGYKSVYICFGPDTQNVWTGPSFSLAEHKPFEITPSIQFLEKLNMLADQTQQKRLNLDDPSPFPFS